MKMVREFAGSWGWRLAWSLSILFVLVILAATIGCGRESPQELVEERCVGCHALSVVETSYKARQEWEATISRMVALGADLNDRQVQEVVDYLSSTYKVEAP